jgi:bifunctional DNase/RNase
MTDYVRIKRLANGYTISVDDPKIEAANRKRKDSVPWVDPTREFVFANVADVLEWLEKNLDKALPDDDFDSSFTAALLEDDEK